MKRKYDKEHRAWAVSVKLRDGNACVICGQNHHLNAHHLIPWEIEKYRLIIDNGISLCPKHHTKYGSGLSPHSHGAALFFIWMMKHRPWQLYWVEEHYEN